MQKICCNEQNKHPKQYIEDNNKTSKKPSNEHLSLIILILGMPRDFAI